MNEFEKITVQYIDGNGKMNYISCYEGDIIRFTQDQDGNYQYTVRPSWNETKNEERKYFILPEKKENNEPRTRIKIGNEKGKNVLSSM